jgi:archaetidylinositol phosphate synthase
MTLDSFRPLADRVVEPLIRGARRVGLTPNVISGLALFVAAGAGVAFAFARSEPRLYLAGAVLIVANGFMDVLDGELARELEIESDAGDLFDHVVDRYADILIIAGLTASVEQYLLGFAAITGVLMTSYLGTQAQAVGLDRVYGGLLGRADRLALATAVTVAAAFFQNELYGLTVVGWLLVVFAVVGHLTAIQRFYYSMGALD